MKITRCFIILLLLCVLPRFSFSQKSIAWLTYGQSKFLYSPGIEGNYFFNRYIGLQAGVNAYIQNYDKNKIVNDTDDYGFNFYNANIGLCNMLLNKEAHKIGLTVGFKVYYGPDFVPLHYYKEGGYDIYYDASQLLPTYGVDMGVFYAFKKVSALVKFDTARQKVRFGIGYTFGKPASSDNDN